MYIVVFGITYYHSIISSDFTANFQLSQLSHYNVIVLKVVLLAEHHSNHTTGISLQDEYCEIIILKRFCLNN